MKIGYARVSTDGQGVSAQIDKLKNAGCEKVFTEVASGAKRDRPVLVEAMEYLRPKSDDVLVVYKLDRVARSLPHLIEIMNDLSGREIGFQSLTEDINTSTPGGKRFFHIMGLLPSSNATLSVSARKLG